MAFYNGFTTVGRNKKFRIHDFELAKQDLINHLNIRKGEKLMQPKFGTIIWDMLFETLTDEVKLAIKADLDAIVRYDPRIEADSVVLTEYENGIMVAIDLRYVATDQVETLKFNFDRNKQV